ncbi:unknown [Clostridium sp. CAG:967]|nr:unknown [Clostridium sp. CAG:967]
MKVGAVHPNSSTVGFNGIAQKMPQYAMNTAENMYSQYNYLRYAKYYEALDDRIFPQNKRIRQENFSFLERIPDYLKGKFVDFYKWITDFPNIYTVSAKIEKEFVNNAVNASNSDVKVLMAGYDPVCSVGLKHALPGSDIDKAYIILEKDQRSLSSDEYYVGRYKGALWNNVDQRILSLNNENTFPEVYTTGQMYRILDVLDDITRQSGLSNSVEYYKYKRELDINPLTAGEFNIKFAKVNNENRISKEGAKNFAYFIEAVRDGKLAYSLDDKITGVIRERVNSSPFAQMSNVTQMGAHERQIKSGMKLIKSKLRNREELAHDFNYWGPNDQFEFVKDLVKSVSKDQGTKFDKYFQNDDDIAERFNRLNRQLV